MGLHKIRKGLNLPIIGDPEQRIDSAPQPARVAVVADDYVGMRPTMHVAVGDNVRRGQLLFEDKKTPGVRYTATAAGTISAIHRGARRALQSVVIQLDPSEASGHADNVSFESFSGRHPKELSREKTRELLLESGLWTAIRMRPFSRVARPEDTPHSIFITVMTASRWPRPPIWSWPAGTRISKAACTPSRG
jgi:Na+-transporting NADH:ubiquinone oxidoreductase subunit A